MLHASAQELRELDLRHLTRRHGKLPVDDRTEARYVAPNLQIVRRVGNHEIGFLATEQSPVAAAR
jgi:hypothetical protein